MLKSISSLGAIVAVSSAASAHAGDHGTLAFIEAIMHFLSEPLHLGALLLASGALLAWRFTVKRSQR